ncbi:MAG: MFS transporter, partial [Gemmataceae bacterium]|nr:MFS transporter [Gemmataceae bacterium]
AIGAVVTPTLILLILRYADRLAGEGGDTSGSWRTPFLVIGLVGVGWVLLWFATVPARLLDESNSPAVSSAAGSARYRDVFADRRFWALLAVVVAINISWHTYRVWLPKYLQQVRGKTEEDMTAFTTTYYIVADVGSWAVGLATLLLIRRGLSGHNVRFLALAACAGLALVSFAVPFAPTGYALWAASLVFAFGALGLFPTYFALSQELSAKHQGKVTGTLGAGAHLFLALVVYPVQGVLIKERGWYDWVLGGAGVFPLLAVGVMLWLWPPRAAVPEPSERAAGDANPPSAPSA